MSYPWRRQDIEIQDNSTFSEQGACRVLKISMSDLHKELEKYQEKGEEPYTGGAIKGYIIRELLEKRKQDEK